MRSWATRHWPELLWAAWVAVNLVITASLINYETVPFHFVWISLTLVYGWRVWRLGPTLLTLAVICGLTGVTLGWVVIHGAQGPDELTEVPLMAAVFLGMVWHAERRMSALDDLHEVVEREHDFVNAASHQLKTPIAIARGLAQLVEAEPGASTAQTDLRDLIDELNRLGHIADDLLLLATARMPDSFVFADVDVEDVIVSAAKRWSRSSDRTWSVNACDGVIDADRRRLDTALDVLIDNALRATRPGDRISLSCEAKDGAAVFVVADSGVGLSAEELPHVFEPFWSEAHDPETQRGTGLGLPIAKAIVEAHGGEITVRSPIGGGATVTVRLPGLRPYSDRVEDEEPSFVLAEAVER